MDVIDNRRERLVDRIYDLLAEKAVSARFAVGYLFLDGLIPILNQLEELPEIEILIGNVSRRIPDAQIREATDARSRGGEDWVKDQEDVAATLRGVHDRCAAETALNVRRTIAELPRTPETQNLLLVLAGRIADGGLKVRLYTHHFIHSKLTLIGYGPGQGMKTGLAIVGSGNVTLGTEAHPTEINIVVSDLENVNALSGWYEDLWNNARDFHRELFDELCRSWALQRGASNTPAGEETS